MDHSLHETRSANMANKRVVEYADSDDSEEEMSQPPRKRPRINFSDDEEDYEDYYTIKPVNQTESRVFRSKAYIYEVDIEKFPDDVSPLHFIPRLFDDMIETRDIAKWLEVTRSV